MDTREKLRAFNTLQDSKFYEADYALLKKKLPDSPVLTIHAVSAKKHREVLFSLLDVASVDEILESRKAVMKELKKDSAGNEKKEIQAFLEENGIKFHPSLGLKKLRALKKKTQEELSKKEKTEDTEGNKEKGNADTGKKDLKSDEAGSKVPAEKGTEDSGKEGLQSDESGSVDEKKDPGVKEDEKKNQPEPESKKSRSTQKSDGTS